MDSPRDLDDANGDSLWIHDGGCSENKDLSGEKGKARSGVGYGAKGLVQILIL